MLCRYQYGGKEEARSLLIALVARCRLLVERKAGRAFFCCFVHVDVKRRLGLLGRRVP